MALAVTLLGTATFNTSSGTKTVTATPAVGDLIVIVTAHTGNTSSATPTDNNSGGTYTTIDSALKATSADKMMIHVRNALIGSASSTVFTHAPGTSSGGGLAVFKVTGMQKVGLSASRQAAKQENQAAATPAPVFASSPLSVNAIIGAVFNATNPAGMTPRTNFTERSDSGYNTPASGLETMSRGSGETSTTQTWGSSSASAFASLVLELDSSQALTPDLFTNSQTIYSANSTYGAAPSLLTNGQAFYAPSVDQIQSLSPSLVSNSQDIFAPSASAGAVTLAPALMAASGQFFAPALGYAATADLITNGQDFPVHTVMATASLLPGLVSDGETFYGPAAAGLNSVFPAFVGSDSSFASPAVSASNAVAAGLFSEGQSFFGPSISQGGSEQNIAPALAANEQAFPAPVFGVGVNPTLAANDNQFFGAEAIWDQVLVAGAFDNVVSIFGPKVSGPPRRTASRPRGAARMGRPVNISRGAR